MVPYKDIVFSDKGIMCNWYVCWGTRKDNGKGILWGKDQYRQAATAHTAHDPHVPALPSSSGMLPPRRRFSLSKCLVSGFFLCASASLCPFSTRVAHGAACMVGGRPTSGVVGCVFGRKGVPGWGRGGGSSVMPSAFPCVGSPSHICVSPHNRLLLSLALGACYVQQALGTMSKPAQRGLGEPGMEGAEAHVAATPAGFYCPHPPDPLPPIPTPCLSHTQAQTDTQTDR